MHVGDLRNELLLRLDGCDALHFGQQRRGPLFLDGALVHAGSIVIANFLLEWDCSLSSFRTSIGRNPRRDRQSCRWPSGRSWESAWETRGKTKKKALSGPRKVRQP